MKPLIEAAPVATADVRTLIAELDATLSADYTPEQRHGLSLEAIFQPHIRFFLARLDGAAVGCGGVACFPGFAEVKRMYVREALRGRGVARAILARLEEETRAAGLGWLRLETGERQLAALRLYARAGFRPCGVFGDYALMPPAAIATSVFLEKRLAASAPGIAARQPPLAPGRVDAGTGGLAPPRCPSSRSRSSSSMAGRG